MMETIVYVKPLEDYQVFIRFSDNYATTVDIKPFIGKGISAELWDSDFFNKVSVNDFGGITWENGFDFCPVFLRQLCLEQAQV